MDTVPSQPKPLSPLNVILFVLLYPLSLPVLYRSNRWNVWVKVLLTLPLLLIILLVVAVAYYAPIINEQLEPTQEVVQQCISECNLDVTNDPYGVVNNQCFKDCFDKAKPAGL